MEKITQLQELLQTAEKDAEKFYLKGNKTAGTRLRTTMQQLKTLAQDVRAEVLLTRKKR